MEEEIETERCLSKKKRRRDEEKRQLFHTLISYEALKIENLKKKKTAGNRGR